MSLSNARNMSNDTSKKCSIYEEAQPKERY